MKLRTWLLGLAVVLPVFVFCQDFTKKGFQRLYEVSGDSLMVNLSSLSLAGGGYMSFDVMEDDVDTIDIRYLVLTNYNDKGNVMESYKIDSVDNQSIETVLSKGDVMINNESNVFHSATVNKDMQESLLLSSTNGPDVNWSKVVNSETTISLLDNMRDSLVIIGHDGDNRNLSLASLNKDGLTANNFSLGFQDTFSVSYTSDLNDLVVVDTMIYLTNTLVNSGTGNSSSISIIDKDLNASLARSYQVAGNSIIVNAIDVLTTGEIVMVGQLTDGVEVNSFISLLDTNGMPIWSKSFSSDLLPVATTIFNDVSVNSNNEIFVSGFTTDLMLLEFFMIKVDRLTGEPTLFHHLDDVDHLFTELSELNDMPNGGVIYSSSFVKDDRSYTGLMHMTQEGELSFCGEEINVSFDDISITSDTLVVNYEEGEEFQDVEITYKSFGSHSVTTLTPESLIFCPNEPIDTIIGEDVPGAIRYEWSTGDTTAMIQILDEGTFIRNVWIDEDYCYNLCDTSMVSRSMVPQVTLQTLLDCSEGNKEYILVPSIMDGRPDFEYLWSTNETTQFISAEVGTTYSVTVTDECNDSDDASVEVNEIITSGTALIDSIDNYCIDGSYTLDADLINSEFVPISYSWNTGESQEMIIVNGSGTYSVTITNECGDMFSEDLVIDPLESLRWPSVFFPITRELENEENRTFGPYNPCENLVPDSYELKIWNRWGQEVFTTDDVSMRWDGKLSGGENAPIGVYVYVATYDYGDGEIKAQGDVTIVR